MRQRMLFAFIAMVFSLTLLAQSDTEDVLYLKTGGIIRGKIVDGRTAGKVKIELLGGSVFVFSTADIDSTKKESTRKSRIKEIQHNYYRKDRGFRNMTELAIIYGVNFKNNPDNANDPDDIGLSLQTINGYQIWPYLFVGGGVGIDRFITYQQTFSPFFVRLSSEFLKKKVTPYVYIDGGYSVMWKQPASEDGADIKNAGGAYCAAGAGVRIYTRSRASVILSAGYKMNMSSSTYNYTYYMYNNYSVSRTYQRFVMNIGVSF